MQASAADRPYELLQHLPRTLWRGALVTSAGERAARLADAARWLAALLDGALPPAAADFGDAAAAAPLREAVGDLGLPALARGLPAVAEQVLRTLFFHLDRIAGLQPQLTRTQAIAHAAADFRAEWVLESAGLEERLALLRGLGDPSSLSWDQLRGELGARDWQAAQRASEWLARLPELAELIRRLGRAERPATAAPPRRPQAQAAGAQAPQPLRAVETVIAGAPGEVTGVCFSGRPESMLGSEAVMLRHPVLRKLWRARHAEARLLSHETQALLVDWRADPAARQRAPAAAPEALERGPLIVCLDTSASMRGAPENIAKAAVIAAVRAAHEARRACLLYAFGGADEIVERELGAGAQGLAGLLATMGQAFDGGTDIQTPIERALARVHEARWRSADLLVVSDGEFGCVPATLERLDAACTELGLRVQGILVGDRETLGLLEVCDDIHWVRDWRRYADAAAGGDGRGHSPVHSRSLTAIYFPNALSGRAARHRRTP
ncbi:MAG: VWA domain-containing protein [Burkholderiales bacterium]|nr:VWA domain-containing protein [Burkholderiales bacterium]